MDKNAEGILAEYQAGEYLASKGYRIVGRNVNFPNVGELDIVCYDGATLVIVEVKYRSTTEHGHPIEALTRAKITKIIKATERYIYANHLEDTDVRFDVIAIKDGIIEHIEDAFYGSWN